MNSSSCSYLSIGLSILGHLVLVQQFDNVGHLFEKLAPNLLLLNKLEVVQKQAELLVESLSVPRLMVEFCTNR